MAVMMLDGDLVREEDAHISVFLDGVTRRFVIRLAKKVGYEVEEGSYTLANLHLAEEIFMTNSLQEMVPVLYGKPPKRLRKGKITQHLYQEYQCCTRRRDDG